MNALADTARILDVTFDDVSTTARDMSAFLRAFTDGFDAEVRRVVDASWPEIVADLAQHAADEDVVVLISDARETWPPRRLPYLMHSVVPRSTAVAITFGTDVRIAERLSRGAPDRHRVEIVVEHGSQLTLVEVDHER